MFLLQLFLVACLSGLGVVEGQFLSECSGEYRYLFLPEFENFTVHENTCVANGGHLATINDQNTSKFIGDFIQYIKVATAIRIPYVYFGLISEEGTDSNEIETWVFIDGTVNEFGIFKFFYPWTSGEPNIKTDDRQVCTVLRGLTLNSERWYDNECFELNMGICQVPCPPTPFPTSNPTESPTLNPTLNPTASPTRKPSTSPTKSPTSNPSEAPSTNPSKSPTKRPTKTPTQNPTTPKPTFSPTRKPTQNPTKRPSLNPTTLPSLSPSKIPTTSRPTTSPILSSSESGVEAGVIAGVTSSLVLLFLVVAAGFAVFALKARKPQVTGNTKEVTNDVSL